MLRQVLGAGFVPDAVTAGQEGEAGTQEKRST
jgi:hypothetical protein